MCALRRLQARGRPLCPPILTTDYHCSTSPDVWRGQLLSDPWYIMRAQLLAFGFGIKLPKLIE